MPHSQEPDSRHSNLQQYCHIVCGAPYKVLWQQQIHVIGYVKSSLDNKDNDVPDLLLLSLQIQANSPL